MSHKGSRSRVQNHEAAREAWERVWGARHTNEQYAHRDEAQRSELQTVRDKIQNDEVSSEIPASKDQ